MAKYIVIAYLGKFMLLFVVGKGGRLRLTAGHLHMKSRLIMGKPTIMPNFILLLMVAAPDSPPIYYSKTCKLI